MMYGTVKSQGTNAIYNRYTQYFQKLTNKSILKLNTLHSPQNRVIPAHQIRIIYNLKFIVDLGLSG